MNIHQWCTAQKMGLALLSSALLSACASMPGSEWTVADGERAVREKLSYLQGVEMRDTFISTETSNFGRTLMCGYINVQTGPQVLGPLLGRYEITPEFIRFIYVYRVWFFQTEYHQGFGGQVSHCVKPGQNIEEAKKASEEAKSDKAVQTEEAKKAERVRSGGW